MGRWIGKIIDHLLVVIGALVFMQAPLFVHEYQQQLIGHVAELHWQVDHMREAASQSGKDIDQYIYKFSAHTDQDIARQGKMMEVIYIRWKKLSAALHSIRQSSVFSRPWAFSKHFQWEIAQSTAHSFKPGISFTIEELLYAFTGMGIGYLFYHTLQALWIRICQFFKRIRKLFQKKEEA